ncbi:ABC transporter ATP-binding protein [Actibacterium ureilyticum]|uniref:ABC transporter ATP-binding protein n=1 Tax=Actibacterium ureilyticum TaxID=1590614 RepID=UPI000BAAD5B0|nr:ABC transporter ATP-binding protein [Actibacterium ureilyticum]
MGDQPILRINGLTKRFNDFTALHSIDLNVSEGEFLTIVGPSGSGKTTLIRLLVGIDEPSDGSIWLRDRRIDEVPANKRPTCMVFQSLALFPHRTVGQNIEFPLKLRKVPPADRRARALELLDLLRLPRDYYGKRIDQCSGGERQRVALARALAFDPEILFFDEPLSALDYRLRKTLEKELKDLHRRTGKTFIYITHSLEEAMVMSDRIAIMRAGRFEQIAPAEQIYAKPVSRFVAGFMGEVNLFDMTAGQVPGVTLSPHAQSRFAGQSGTLMIRPESLSILPPSGTADICFTAVIEAEYLLGSRMQYTLRRAGGGTVTVEVLREDAAQGGVGAEITLGCPADACHLIAEVPDAA